MLGIARKRGRMVRAMSSARRRLRRGLVWLRHHVTRWGRQPTAPTLTQSSASRADPPLCPVYPFNDPGQSIVLHDGLIGGLATNDVPGVVELSCIPELNLAWGIKHGSDTWIPTGEVTLLLRGPDGDVRLPGARRDSGEGWSNGAEIARFVAGERAQYGALVRRSPRSTATGACPVPAPAGGRRSPRRIRPCRARPTPADCRPAGSASLSLRAAAHRGRATAHHRRSARYRGP